jgi:hypothetical protein
MQLPVYKFAGTSQVADSVDQLRKGWIIELVNKSIRISVTIHSSKCAILLLSTNNQQIPKNGPEGKNLYAAVV